MREFGPGHPLVFSHIPKTAGNSLRVALQQTLQPSVLAWGVDTSLWGGYDDLDEIRPQARDTIYRSPEDLPADATFVAGHIAPWTTMTRYPGADHITILRAPQVRIVSQWLHSRGLSELSLRHWGPTAEAFRIGWRPLREYLEHPMIAPNTDNTMTRFFAWPHDLLSRTAFIEESQDEELLGAAISRIDLLAHANVVENSTFMQELGAWLGRDLPTTRLNERRSVPSRRRPDLAAELDGGARELLEHRARIDARLWEHVARRVLPDVDAPELLRTTVDTAMDRYVAMLHEPHESRPVRDAVERLYEVGVRLDPRRRAARR